MDNARDALIESWLAEVDVGNDVYEAESSSDEEIDNLEEEDHQSESEQEQDIPGEGSDESSEEDNPPQQRRRRTDFYRGVDDTLWSKTVPLNRGRTRSHNIVFVPPGPKGTARQKTTLEDCMSLFFDDHIIHLITKYTNKKIDYIKEKYRRERDAKQTNETEIRGYIGILLMAGVVGKRKSTAIIFEHVKHTGIDAIYLTMSEKRFKFITRVLRFDDIEDRQDHGAFRLSNERHDIVMRMAQPVLGKNMNITMDNWFSSLRTAKQLFENGTTMVGTVRKDKREVPREFRVARGNPLHSSKFGFHPPCTLLSYVAKPNKVVIMISTMHNDATIDEDSGDSRKPEVITYYNRTKNGVDLVDKMCSMYDVARNSRRWPLTVFFRLLNLSALNALCIYTANKNYEHVSRRESLIDLSLAWMKPLAQKRLEKKTLPRTLTIKIKDFLGITYAETQPTTSQGTSSNVVRRCHDCGRARNKSTRKMCTKCSKFVCGDHLKIMCLSCAENNI
ncbi:hypothetical protein HF086_004064 [Spodoptera exigua]|uniref:PiggyBac transposable element-derived protein domain-containing protein n=1 Tax=Spodoptera exigua TaxID=7107 RepID=A0A922SD62_SPOEX|nr:hypothetical protein HF086_004064 [Spodoptera exigua]